MNLAVLFVLDHACSVQIRKGLATIAMLEGIRVKLRFEMTDQSAESGISDSVDHQLLFILIRLNRKLGNSLE